MTSWPRLLFLAFVSRGQAVGRVSNFKPLSLELWALTCLRTQYSVCHDELATVAVSCLCEQGPGYIGCFSSSNLLFVMTSLSWLLFFACVSKGQAIGRFSNFKPLTLELWALTCLGTQYSVCHGELAMVAVPCLCEQGPGCRLFLKLQTFELRAMGTHLLGDSIFCLS